MAKAYIFVAPEALPTVGALPCRIVGSRDCQHAALLTIEADDLEKGAIYRGVVTVDGLSKTVRLEKVENGDRTG